MEAPARYRPGRSGSKGLIVVFCILVGINSAFSRHFIAGEIFVIRGDFIYQLSVWKDFHNAVGGSLDELMIMAGKKFDAGEFDQAVI